MVRLTMDRERMKYLFREVLGVDVDDVVRKVVATVAVERAKQVQQNTKDWKRYMDAEGGIVILPSASMYRFQSFVFCCTCFARSMAIVATTFRTTSSTSTPRTSRNRYFIRSRSMVSRTIRGGRIRENCQWSRF